jgi:hypothetical protein
MWPPRDQANAAARLQETTGIWRQALHGGRKVVANMPVSPIQALCANRR